MLWKNPNKLSGQANNIYNIVITGEQISASGAKRLARVPALPFMCSVTLGKLLNLTGPQFPYLQHGNNASTCVQGTAGRVK